MTEVTVRRCLGCATFDHFLPQNSWIDIPVREGTIIAFKIGGHNQNDRPYNAWVQRRSHFGRITDYLQFEYAQNEIHSCRWTIVQIGGG